MSTRDRRCLAPVWESSGKTPLADNRFPAADQGEDEDNEEGCSVLACDNIGKVMKLIFSLSCAGERNMVSCVPRWSLNDGDDCPMIAP